ncbi:AbrB family transcriptional regulator [Nocardioides houyundeii]|uniref:AbrB family transcriptional regulator n=1 Tax=Nocardioides houyundeii TaxID=2045452 RepID=UPI000DF1C1A1|nr:AbrB family transcriptional regulator [Nocardioides houyundeii]
MAVVRRWSLLAVAVAAACAAFWLVRLPTPFLFGGLVGALVYALARPARPLALPGRWFTGGQAVVGAVVGAAVDWRSLVALGPSWVLVVAVSCFSLAVSVLAGQLLVRHRVSRATATFSSIAGGAAGLTALAEELGADARVVAVLQYLRLLVVLVTMPVVVFLVFGGEDSGATTALEAVTGHTLLRDFSYAAAAIGLGLLAGTWLRLPSGAILGPLLVAALLALVPWWSGAEVPPVVVAVGYLCIGIQVGLKFTVASLRAIGAMVPTALLTIALTLLACAGLAAVLTLATDQTPLEAYLATTPGGIYAVMGTAAATGSDVTFVAAAQVLRLLIVLASAPFVAAYLKRFSDASDDDDDQRLAG